VLSLLQRLSTSRYLHLLLSAEACNVVPTAVDGYLLPAGRSAAKLTITITAVNRWDIQTDRRMEA